MNKVTRVKHAVAGEAVDKVPFSFWSHLSAYDLNPELVAQKTYEIYKRYDLDFIKLMNNGMYSAQAFGATIDSSKVATGGRTELVETPVQKADDIKKFSLANFDQSIYDRELSHLQHVLNLVDGEAPVLLTIFSPLTTLDKLALGKVNDFITAGKGDLLIPALELITQTTIALAQEAIDRGAAGIYFATQLASFDRLSEESYASYGRPYDLQILESVKTDGWLNTLHIHGDNIMFDLLKDYPVPVFNWHNWDTDPAIEEGKAETNKAIMGGIARSHITNGDLEELAKEVSEDIKRLNGKHLLLSSNCSIRQPFDGDTINYIRQIADETFTALH